MQGHRSQQGRLSVQIGVKDIEIFYYFIILLAVFSFTVISFSKVGRHFSGPGQIWTNLMWAVNIPQLIREWRKLE